MASSRCVSHWIEQLRAGDQVAARRLWEGYFRRLVGLARGKLQSLPCRAGDEEDADLRTIAAWKMEGYTTEEIAPPGSGAFLATVAGSRKLDLDPAAALGRVADPAADRGPGTMSLTTRTHITTLPLTVAERLDAVCDRFEAACGGGPRPRIDDYLEGIEEPARAILQPAS